MVSPLAVAAVLEESLLAGELERPLGGGGRVRAHRDPQRGMRGSRFGPLLGRTHDTVLEVLSRLLGVLLAAVGVQLFLVGLTTLGVIQLGH